MNACTAVLLSAAKAMYQNKANTTDVLLDTLHQAGQGFRVCLQ